MLYGWLTAASFFLKRRIAIGMVLATPERNNDQPSALRFDCLNLSASNSPAPNPRAPRVAAMIAISGTVKVLTFEFDIFTVISSAGKTQVPCRFYFQVLLVDSGMIDGCVY